MSEHMNGASHAAPKKAPKPIIEQAPPAPADADGQEGAAATTRFSDIPQGSHGRAQRLEPDEAPVVLHGAAAGFFRNAGRFAWAYVNAHPHAVLYGVIGFMLAVLILSIGLWDTLVIAVFVGVGVVFGQMVDGDNALVNFIGRMINGRK